MPVGIDGNGIITGVSDFSSSNVSLTDPEITGGIYLGGTGSANYLDDYEEGTWTPTYFAQTTDFDSVTYNTQEGYYTKVGNLVNVRLFIRTDDITLGSASGNVRIGGLPFTPENIRAASGILSFAFASNNPSTCQASDKGPSLILYYKTSVGGDGDNTVQPSDMGTASADNGVILSLCYQST